MIHTQLSRKPGTLWNEGYTFSVVSAGHCGWLSTLLFDEISHSVSVGVF